MERISKARWKKEKWDRQDSTNLIQKYIKPGIFFHMSDLGPGASNTDRFGINPKQSWDTPFGIYGYPLDREYSQHLIKGTLPFRQEAPWVHVFKVALSKCVIASKYSSSQYQRDYEVLIKRAGISNRSELENAEKSAYVKTPAGKLWNVTRVLALVESTGNPILRWNRIFRDLGYESFWDDDCQGIIHKNEKCQIVVFATNYAKRLDVLPNPSNNVGYRQYTKPAKIDFRIFDEWDRPTNNSFEKKIFIDGLGLIVFSVEMVDSYSTILVSIKGVEYETYFLNKSMSLSDSVFKFHTSKANSLPVLLKKCYYEVFKKRKPLTWKFQPTAKLAYAYASYAFRGLIDKEKYMIYNADVGTFILLAAKGYGYSVALMDISTTTLDHRMKLVDAYNISKPEHLYFFSRKSDAVSYMKKWREKEVARLKAEYGTSL